MTSTYSSEHAGWEIIPKEADEAPRAIWWNYTGFSPKWGNPNAEVLGYFYEYPEIVPKPLLQELTARAVSYINSECDGLEMHEMYCYVRLSERAPQA